MIDADRGGGGKTIFTEGQERIGVKTEKTNWGGGIRGGSEEAIAQD